MIRPLLAIALLWSTALAGQEQAPPSQVDQDLEQARHFLARQDRHAALAAVDAARRRLEEQMALAPDQIAAQRREWEADQIGRRSRYLHRWAGPVAAVYLAALLAGIFWGLRKVQRIDSGRAA
jgi:hypothetical protein